MARMMRNFVTPLCFALLFGVYVTGVIAGYARIGMTVFALSAVPVLYTAVRFGMWRALGLYAFCFLVVDSLLLLCLEPGTPGEVLRLRLNEEVLMGMVLGVTVTAMVGGLRDTLRKAARLHREVEVRNRELEQALKEIKVLRGILPICANCKRIRDDAGSWQMIELYIRQRSEAEFSHGMCPDCAKEWYPDLQE